MGNQQVEQVRRLAYEELLWLADDLVRRQHDHRSGDKLSPKAAAEAALAYLRKAETARQPTRAVYTLRSRCHKTLGDAAAEQADSQLSDQTPATIALDYYLVGQSAFAAGDLAEGVEAFESALQLEPTHYWSMMRLGYCLCELGETEEDFRRAATAFGGCILTRPDHAHAYYCRARAYFRLGRDEEAVADNSRAIDLDPKVAHAWYNRGVSYDRLGRPDKAVIDFGTAVELDPNFLHAWHNLGAAHSQLGKPDKALKAYLRAIELDPTYSPAWNGRGVAYAKLGEPDSALADFTRALELDSANAM